MRIFKYVSLIILALLLWTAIITAGLVDGFLLRPFAAEQASEAFIAATEDKLQEAYVGNFAMTIIEDGKVVNSYYYAAVDEIIDEHTLFHTASISKWLTAIGVMSLVEDGLLDLDKPVEDYLSRWHLPESEFNHDEVTIRRLLSHSAGLVDDLGYDGFALDEHIQTIEESLTNADDGYYEGAGVRVGYQPGTKYRYSGGGYTLLQLVIEEVTGESFPVFMDQEVLDPLGMKSSTFLLAAEHQLRLAKRYKTDSTTQERRQFTALAAAGLYSTTADLSKLLIAQVSANPVLSNETILQMSEAQTFINGVGVYGLGPDLYSQGDMHSTIIGHDGSGNALNTAARIDLQSKNGIIILESGHHSMASDLADEWIFWTAGIADRVVIERNFTFLGFLLTMGYLVVAILAIVLIRKDKLKRTML